MLVFFYISESVQLALVYIYTSHLLTADCSGRASAEPEFAPLAGASAPEQIII